MDYQSRGGYLCANPPAGENLEATPATNLAREIAGDRNMLGVYRGRNRRAFGDEQGAVTGDVSFQLTFDPKIALRAKVSIERRVPIDETHGLKRDRRFVRPIIEPHRRRIAHSFASP
jgi:hypothetical protein